MSNFNKQLLKYIPGGAHTYSRGFDAFPKNAPQILKYGKGVKICDHKKRELIDFGMGLRSVNIGYSETEIDKAAFRGIKQGNNLTRPSLIELEAAKKFIGTIKKADMVKFGKNGSISVTAAVKLARAYTKKKIILRCSSHPFFSFDDWFIGSTVISRGIPRDVMKLTDTFEYNKIESLKSKIKKYKNQIACVVMEPATDQCPEYYGQTGCCNQPRCERSYYKNHHYLKQVQQLCNENKILFILDEMITGFRWHLGGAQELYGLNPDLSTFGKAMANGFSVSAVCGKKEIMELGSVVKKNQERVFLLSTTHGAEMGPLNAFIKTIDFIKKNKVIETNWKTGFEISSSINLLSKQYGLFKNFFISGPACSPVFTCLDNNLKNNLSFRTLFIQEMIKNGVLMPWISIAYRHKDKKIIKKTLDAVDRSLFIYKKALNNGIKRYLKGPPIKPVFRKYN